MVEEERNCKLYILEETVSNLPCFPNRFVGQVLDGPEMHQPGPLLDISLKHLREQGPVPRVGGEEVV